MRARMNTSIKVLPKQSGLDRAKEGVTSINIFNLNRKAQRSYAKP